MIIKRQAYRVAACAAMFVAGAFGCAFAQSVSKGPAGHAGARLLQPGVISTGREYGATVSPDGSVLYFTRGKKIYWSRKDEHGWRQARLAKFANGAWTSAYLGDGVSIEHFAWDPVISPDGSQLFFMSHDLVDGKITQGGDANTDIWVMDRVGPGYEDTAWGPPRPLGDVINSPNRREGAAGISRDGTLYFFSSNRPDSLGSGDIYYSKRRDGVYQPAVNIGPVLNTDKFDGHTYPDPDGRFLLFISNDRPHGYGGCDIYVSFPTDAGWSTPVNLGPKVNTERCELTPSLSPDGRILYFARIDNRETNERNIYFIPLSDTNFPVLPE